MAKVEEDACMPIAVIGMGCRFPGDATSPELLWDFIANGRSAWSEFPKDRINIDGFYHPSGDRQGSVKFLICPSTVVESNASSDMLQRWPFSKR